jgi:hypothetical protein
MLTGAARRAKRSRDEFWTVILPLFPAVRAPHRERNTFFVDAVQTYSRKDWVKTFRVSRAVFDVIADGIATSQYMRYGVRARGGLSAARALSIADQLAIFLYRVGRRSNYVWDIAEQFGVSQWAVEHATKRVSLAIMEQFSERVSMPQTAAEGADVGINFSTTRGRSTHDPWAFDGTRGALDVVHMQIVPDTLSRGDAVSSVFANRNNNLSVCFQGITDSAGRFLEFSGAFVGSQVDQMTLYSSTVWAERDKHLDLSLGQFLIADGGYALNPYVMIPYDKHDMALRTPAGQHLLKMFNMIFSSKRSSVENGFGGLKARFALCGSTLWFRDMALYTLVPRACAALHNRKCQRATVIDTLFTATYSLAPTLRSPSSLH